MSGGSWPMGRAFGISLMWEYESPGGLAGPFDQTLLARSARKAADRTIAALERELGGLDSDRWGAGAPTDPSLLRKLRTAAVLEHRLSLALAPT